MYLFCGERFIAMAKISYGYYDISVNLGDRLDRSLGSYTDLNRALVAAEHIAMDENPIIIQALMSSQKETDKERKLQMLNEIHTFMADQ